MHVVGDLDWTAPEIFTQNRVGRPVVEPDVRIGKTFEPFSRQASDVDRAIATGGSGAEGADDRIKVPEERTKVSWPTERLVLRVHRDVELGHVEELIEQQRGASLDRLQKSIQVRRVDRA